MLETVVVAETDAVGAGTTAGVDGIAPRLIWATPSAIKVVLARGLVSVLGVESVDSGEVAATIGGMWYVVSGGTYEKAGGETADIGLAGGGGD